MRALWKFPGAMMGLLGKRNYDPSVLNDHCCPPVVVAEQQPICLLAVDIRRGLFSKRQYEFFKMPSLSKYSLHIGKRQHYRKRHV